MLNSGKKFALWTKKKNILTIVLSKKKFLNETKNHNLPLQVKWSVPKCYCFDLYLILYRKSNWLYSVYEGVY